MKALLLAVAAAGSMLVAGQAGAADAAQALAQKSGCLACHSIDKKVLGPAYKDVAAKYKGDKTAEAKLIAKVKAGGSGVWGPMPMPANSPQVKDADIKTIVEWVLSL
jgi:cytochrome c